MANPIPTTDDLGNAIHDALGLLEGIELDPWQDDGPADRGTVAIDHIDNGDPSNLRIISGGAVFVVRIIREG